MTPLKTAFLAATAALAITTPAALAAPLSDGAFETVRPADARGAGAIRPLLAEAGYGPVALAALKETQRHESPVSGRTYLTFEQRVGDRLVHGSYLRAVIEPDGTLSQVVHRIADIKTASVPDAMSLRDEALGAAVSEPFGFTRARVAWRDARRVVFDAGDDFQTAPVAEEVLVADEDGELSAAMLVTAWAKEGNELVVSLVGADGRVLDEENRTSNDSYVAYATNPGEGNARVMSGAQANKTASPRGWLGSQAQYSNRISGYNVEAYADTNADNKADGGGRRVTNGVFGATADLKQAATVQRNEDAAVQNLFYQINTIHDRLYEHGFTETAGNFQRDNYGRGGVGGDHVLAEALDGGGTRNANIAVPTNDGTYYGEGPRMQMYRWTGTNPDRAGSFDGDIVWHEYGHGVIWRMVGDLDKPISWAVNEGFADAIAVVATGDDRVGEWAANRSAGIRSARYGATGKRLGSYRAGKGNAHRNGEIYGAAMWAVREEFRKEGRSDDQLMGLMIDGLANTNPRPTFIDMRDGLLRAGGGADDCRVWRGFAKIGMGQGARMSWSGSVGSPSISLRESYSVPSNCSKAPAPVPTPAPAPKPSTALTVAAIDADGVQRSSTRWIGQAIITVEQDGRPVSRRNVQGVWSTGAAEGCRTDAQGRCAMVLWYDPSGRHFTQGSPDLTFTVKTVDGSNATGAVRGTATNPFGAAKAPAPTTAGAVIVTGIQAKGVRRSTTRWTPVATITVQKDGQPISRRMVEGTWSTGERKTCKTDTQGRCDVVAWRDKSGESIDSSTTKATFTVQKVDRKTAKGSTLIGTARSPF